MSEAKQILEFPQPPSSVGIDKLVDALAKAQAEFDPVLKDSQNPAFRSRYADLASVIRATQKSLSKHGLVIIQFPVTIVAEQQAGVRTILAHSSGQSIESTYMLPAVMHSNFTAQSVGSAITYARRYSYQAAIGVAGEDDDGNAAAGSGSKDAAKDVAVRKIKEAAKGNEDVFLTPWKEDTLAISGNGLSILKASMTDDEKALVNIKYNQASKVFWIKAADGFSFSDLAKKYDVECKWMEAAQ